MPTNLRLPLFFGGLLTALSGSPVVAQPWTPPLGIPTPSFGIAEEAPAAPNPWNSEVAGFYYVNPQTGSDSGRTYGRPGAPRATIPSSLPAGSVVELHGTFSGDRVVTWRGTAANPIFVRGASPSDRPVFTGEWDLRGSYFILENIDMNYGGTVKGAFTFLAPVDHAALRHCDVSGSLNGGGLAIVTYDASSGNDIVVWDNFIHDNGDVSTLSDQDVHGIVIGDKFSNVWLVDNVIARNSGDGLQINGNNTTTHHIYVGRNESYGNKQTGLWIKYGSDVIFSQNVVHGHRPSGSSGGQGLGFQYEPGRLWFLFNESYDNTVGTGTGSGGTPRGPAYYVGNVLHDNLRSGMELNGWVAGQYVVNNTFYNNPIGLENGYYRVGVVMSNNIFSASSTAHISFREYGSGASSDLRTSLFDAPVRIVWDDVTRDVAGMQGIGECQGCRTGSPLFANAAARDYRLLAGSPAIDGGVLESVYATFQSLYGIDIRKDKAGTARPQGAAWDMGAYEGAAVLAEISVADAAGLEGDEGTRPLGFPVTLAKPSPYPVTVAVGTVDSDATGGSDYQPLSSSISFAPGVTSQTVNIGLVGDYVWEPDEQFKLRLSNAVGGTLVRPEAVGTVLNDDSPGFTIRDAYAVERSGAVARFVVTLAPSQTATATVNYATSDGSAVAGSDYQPAAGSLSFPAGTTERVIDVAVTPDSLAEGVETFTVTLSGASGSPLVRAQAAGRIFDPGSFFTVLPCRVIDTRGPTGPYGGPALVASASRTFSLPGRCGIPPTATAVALNVTEVGATALGHLILHPAGTSRPLASTLNYRAGSTIANNVLVRLGAGGAVAVYCGQSAGSAHLVVDVVGYFE